jgi:hypothetical protein
MGVLYICTLRLVKNTGSSGTTGGANRLQPTLLISSSFLFIQRTVNVLCLLNLNLIIPISSYPQWSRPIKNNSTP